MAVMNREEPDRVPRFEIWIDALYEELGYPDIPAAHVGLGQDCVMMPGQSPPDSNAWKTGVDEWGRVWEDGMYHTGVVETEADLERYTPSAEYVTHLFDEEHIRSVRQQYPDHCLIFGTHIGPFTQAYMAMGLERFFINLYENINLARKVLQARTDWAIVVFQRAVDLGAEIIVVGDDAAYKSGPMISPTMWQEVILPYHQQITDALRVPVIWHSDGHIGRLLPMAVEAGFAGVHGIEPAAGMDLKAVKAEYQDHLIIIGNLDVRVLCESDLDQVRREVDRCLEQGSPGGGYMIATCNSIFEGMDAAAVAEMFRYQEEVI
jgi:uroporphyrinogen decarboxylase